MALGIGKTTRWMTRHPKSMLGTAAFLGMASVHPLKKSGIFPALSEQISGDPNFAGKAINASLQRTAHDLLATEGERNAFRYLGSNYSRMPSTSLYGPGGGPSGNIVFGMHNLRIR